MKKNDNYLNKKKVMAILLCIVLCLIIFGAAIIHQVYYVNTTMKYAGVEVQKSKKTGLIDIHSLPASKKKNADDFVDVQHIKNIKKPDPGCKLSAPEVESGQVSVEIYKQCL